MKTPRFIVTTETLRKVPGKVHIGEAFAVQVEDHPDKSGKSGQHVVTIWTEDDEAWGPQLSFSSAWLPELMTLLRKAK